MLEDRDFVDDICLLSNNGNHLQRKSNELNKYAKQLDLNISKMKTNTTQICDKPSPTYKN